jgi:threonine synthase
MTTGPLAVAGRRGIIRRYFDHLDVSDKTPIITLDEGDTPLIYSDSLSSEIEADVWLKYEGLNPTGSFKDRGMTVAISKAVEERAEAVICASTGNTSASAAAYAARAGLRCAVLVGGFVARAKLAQAIAHAARVVEIDGSFDGALQLSREIAASRPVTLVNSVNPHRIEGQKTAAFEIVEALGRAPDIHVMPVGNAGNITACYAGYKESVGAGWAAHIPAMFGVQASGADPIVQGHPIARPSTLAAAIRIGNPASWKGALEAVRGSGGAMGSVDDQAILDAYRRLAREGIFVELASAAAVAGLTELARDGSVPPGSTVVCVLTGHGLKDADVALAESSPPPKVPARPEAVLRVLGLD